MSKKKVFDDVTTSDYESETASSVNEERKPPAEAPAATLPPPTVRHSDPNKIEEEEDEQRSNEAAAPIQHAALNKGKKEADVNVKEAAAVAAAPKPVEEDQPAFPSVKKPAREAPQASKAPLQFIPDSKTKRDVTKAPPPAPVEKVSESESDETSEVEEEEDVNEQGEELEVRVNDDTRAETKQKEGRNARDAKRNAGGGGDVPRVQVLDTMNQVHEPGYRPDAYEQNDDDEKDPLLLNAILAENDQSFDFSRYIFPRFDARLLNYYIDPKKTLQRQGVEPPNLVELFVAYMIAADLRITVHFLLLVVSICFTIVSLPTAQLDLPNRACYTYFGYKENCDAALYTTSISELQCTNIKTRLQAGAAFTIMGLIIQLFCFLCSWIMIFCLPIRVGTKEKKRAANKHLHGRNLDSVSLASQDDWMRETEVVAGCRTRFIIGGIGLVNFIFMIIPWACVAAIYHTRYCEDKTVPRNTSYGVGFGLCISAWLIHAFSLLVILVMPTSLI